MSTVTVETVIDFLRSGGGHVTYTELKHHFSSFLNDPVNQEYNRQQFKELLKKIATFSAKDGEKVITLKERYRGPSNANGGKVIAKQEPVTSVTPKTSLATMRPTSTPLSVSKDSGFSQSLSQSVRASACPAKTEETPEKINSNVRKQWITAMANGDISVMKVLLKDKSDLLDEADSALGFTAFHWAATTGNCELIEFLASRTKNADLINRVSRAGHTPLHVAYMQNKLTAAHLLEKRGADPLAEDFDSRQPVYYSRLNNAFSRTKHNDVSPTLSQGRRKITTLEKVGRYGTQLASKMRDKLRSISSSNSSIDSLPSSSSSTASHGNQNHRLGSGHLYGFSSDQGKRYLDTDGGRTDPRYIRGLSASTGTLSNVGMQLTPHLAISHLQGHKSKSADLSPPLQEHRKSSEIMPPPPRPPPYPNSRV